MFVASTCGAGNFVPFRFIKAQIVGDISFYDRISFSLNLQVNC